MCFFKTRDIFNYIQKSEEPKRTVEERKTRQSTPRITMREYTASEIREIEENLEYSLYLRQSIISRRAMRLADFFEQNNSKLKTCLNPLGKFNIKTNEEPQSTLFKRDFDFKDTLLIFKSLDKKKTSINGLSEKIDKDKRSYSSEADVNSVKCTQTITKSTTKLIIGDDIRSTGDNSHIDEIKNDSTILNTPIDHTEDKKLSDDDLPSTHHHTTNTIDIQKLIDCSQPKVDLEKPLNTPPYNIEDKLSDTKSSDTTSRYYQMTTPDYSLENRMFSFREVFFSWENRCSL
ncbi:hypothetical protein NGRA_1502 [Nosema granulosis]|uniref:Uncharacterized protein n=1 Tax=Nosema granulosis TaxID=83296 RepID=A0A9P6KYK1_9MICR|nr:hypothetical protein NGRA_1502 [Nosema granulosis]